MEDNLDFKKWVTGLQGTPEVELGGQIFNGERNEPDSDRLFNGSATAFMYLDEVLSPTGNPELIQAYRETHTKMIQNYLKELGIQGQAALNVVKAINYDVLNRDLRHHVQGRWNKINNDYEHMIISLWNNHLTPIVRECLLELVKGTDFPSHTPVQVGNTFYRLDTILTGHAQPVQTPADIIKQKQLQHQLHTMAPQQKRDTMQSLGLGVGGKINTGSAPGQKWWALNSESTK